MMSQQIPVFSMKKPLCGYLEKKGTLYTADDMICPPPDPMRG